MEINADTFIALFCNILITFLFFLFFFFFFSFFLFFFFRLDWIIFLCSPSCSPPYTQRNCSSSRQKLSRSILFNKICNRISHDFLPSTKVWKPNIITSYFNKPYGINHWILDTLDTKHIAHQWQRLTYESVIVLIEWYDMIILRFLFIFIGRCLCRGKLCFYAVL